MAAIAHQLASIDSLTESLNRTLASMRDARACVEARALANERDGVRFVSTLFPDCVVALCSYNHPDVFQPPRAPSDAALCDLRCDGSEQDFYQSLYQRVVEEDRVAIAALYRTMQAFLRDTQRHILPPRLRARLLYRRLDARGTPVWISDEKLAFETRGGKYLYVTLLRRASTMPQPAVATLVLEEEVDSGGLVHLATFTAAAPSDALTAREAEITTLVSRGLSTKQIAGELGLSANTVRNVRSRVLRKTGAANAAELSARWR